MGEYCSLQLTHLLRCETFHVRTLNDVVEIFMQVCDVGVDSDLVLPLKLGPHLPELCVGAGRRYDVVHDVNVDVVQDDTVSVTSGTRRVIYWQRKSANMKHKYIK